MGNKQSVKQEPINPIRDIVPVQSEPFRPVNNQICNQSNVQCQSEEVELGQRAWERWQVDYARYESDPQKIFYDRLATNTDQYEKENSMLRMKRLTETSNLYTLRDSTRILPSINSYIPIESKLLSYRKTDEKHYSLEPKRPKLTPEMLDRIASASRESPQDELLVELDGVQILRKDIQRLRGLNWLNDEIINVYMNLLVLRGKTQGYKTTYAFNTFFYPKLKENGYSSVRRWTRRVNIFSYDYLVVPVHLGNHWCLAFVDFSNKEISYYDSLGGQTGGCCYTMLDYLREESNDKLKQPFNEENWKLINKFDEGIPIQHNFSDCGVFACIYAEYLTRGAKLTFTQEHIPYFRKKMIYEIVTKRILE